MPNTCPLCSGTGSRSAVVARQLHDDPRQHLLCVEPVTCDGCNGTGKLHTESKVLQFAPTGRVRGERRELEVA